MDINLLYIIGLAASGFGAGYFRGKSTKKGKLCVSEDALEDAISNGILKKLNQQVLSDETGIPINTFVGGKKNK